MRGPVFVAASLALAASAACAGSSAPATDRPLPDGVEAFSLLGDTLRPLPLSDATRSAYQARLDSARRAVEANPADADALIWLGRRTAYLGRYREAIAIFTRGVERFPSDARFLRHRGHRWISVRETQRAVADLDHAARLVRGTPDVVEPDGLPNARGIPTSTLHTNTWYHLGLAHYLRADFDRALEAYRACLAASRNPDMDVAARYWLYLTLRRLGRTAEAAAVLEPVRADLDIIENRSYYRLLLVFKGLLPADSITSGEGVDGATTAYGLGAFLLVQGDKVQAEYVFRRAMAGGQWPSFGYIAAEAEVARSSGAR